MFIGQVVPTGYSNDTNATTGFGEGSGSAQEGQMYYNTTNNIMYVHNGTAWKALYS
tara:strand:+ start:310 stop:477 length:168 start_codon:yes stop_codon:yes gene_type:complete